MRKTFFLFVMACQLSVSISMSQSIVYHWMTVDSLNIFYRQAGDPAKPVIVLLHGFPSSSVMWQGLMEDLKDDFFLIAPDYPAFGYSDMPDRSKYKYTFDNIANTMDKFIFQLGLKKYSLMMQDYGAPVGFRIALKHSERIEALIVQNGNAYMDGIPEAQDEKGELQTWWRDRNKTYEKTLDDSYASLQMPNAGEWKNRGAWVNPDRRMIDRALLKRPGVVEINKDLWFNYSTNVASYSLWQKYLRDHQPPTLITWGKNDTGFIVPGALAYLRDVPNAEVHLLDGGHWAATEENTGEIAQLIRTFFAKHSIGKQK